MSDGRKVDIPFKRKTYGLPYMGGKSRIAPWIVAQLPAAETFVDLFAGGCAVTHCAMESRKFARIIANDITGLPKYFVDAARGKPVIGELHVPSRQEFFRDKGKNPVRDMCFSYGYRGKTYMYSRQNEAIMLHAERAVIGATPKERSRAIRALCRVLRRCFEETGAIPINTRTSFHGANSMLRVLGIGELQGIAESVAVSATQLDYRDVQIPAGAVVYADPPYRGTQRYDNAPIFDFDAFDAWLADVPFPVFVSEYTVPSGCKQLNETTIQRLFSGNTKAAPQATERLCVQERFYDEVLAATEQPRLLADGGAER